MTSDSISLSKAIVPMKVADVKGGEDPYHIDGDPSGFELDLSKTGKQLWTTNSVKIGKHIVMVADKDNARKIAVTIEIVADSLVTINLSGTNG